MQRKRAVIASVTPMETIKDIASVIVNGSAESKGLMSQPIGVRLSVARYKQLMAICEKYEKQPGPLCRELLELAIPELFESVQSIGGELNANISGPEELVSDKFSSTTERL